MKLLKLGCLALLAGGVILGTVLADYEAFSRTVEDSSQYSHTVSLKVERGLAILGSSVIVFALMLVFAGVKHSS